VAAETGDAQAAGAIESSAPPVLSYLAAAGLLVAATVEAATVIVDFRPESLEFKSASCVLAVVAAVGTLLPQRTARAILTATAIGGLPAAALWPPYELLDTGHPVPAWTAFAILALTCASLAAGWREGRLPPRNLGWLLFAGLAVGWVLVTALDVGLLIVAVMTSTWTF
jgi:hypothetical protein